MRITGGLGAHAVLVTAATREVYVGAPMLLHPVGTVVAVGLPPDPTVLAGAPPVVHCLRRLNVVGSVVGTLKDVEEALDFTARGLVHPILTKGTLDDVDKYCELMIAGRLAGRAMLKVS
jgi:alcohol dehydrogenase, propanol-preferring